MTFKQALEKTYPDVVFHDKDGNVAIRVGRLVWVQADPLIAPLNWYEYRIEMGVDMAGAHVELKERNRLDYAEIRVRIDAKDYPGAIHEMLSSALKIFGYVRTSAAETCDVVALPGKLTEIAGTLVNGKAAVSIGHGCISLDGSTVTYTQTIPDGKDYNINGTGILKAVGPIDVFELDEMLATLRTFLGETVICGLEAKIEDQGPRP